MKRKKLLREYHKGNDILKKENDLSSEVFKDGGEVDGSPGADPLGVSTLLKKAGDPSHRELEAGFNGLGDGLSPGSTPPPTGRLRRLRCLHLSPNHFQTSLVTGACAESDRRIQRLLLASCSEGA